MPTTAPRQLGGIEAARGLAAAAVVLFHAARHVAKAYGATLPLTFLAFGHTGVDLFFVISGFIILYIHYDDIGRPLRLGRYVRRRLTRIYPPYWLALVATIIMDAIAHNALPSSMSVIRSLSLIPSRTEPLLGIAWTLQFEIVFYVEFAVLIAHRRAGLALFACFLLWTIATLLGLASSGPLPPSLCETYVLEFFIGMATAWYLRAVPPAQRPMRGTPLLCAGIILFALVGAAEDAGFLNPQAPGLRLAYGAPAGLIVLGLAILSERGVTFPRPLLLLGRASYSIYLFQFVCIGLIWHVWQPAGPHAPMLAFVTLATAGLAGGTLIGVYVERPLLAALQPARRKESPTALRR